MKVLYEHKPRKLRTSYEQRFFFIMYLQFSVDFSFLLKNQSKKSEFIEDLSHTKDKMKKPIRFG